MHVISWLIELTVGEIWRVWTDWSDVVGVIIQVYSFYLVIERSILVYTCSLVVYRCLYAIMGEFESYLFYYHVGWRRSLISIRVRSAFAWGRCWKARFGFYFKSRFKGRHFTSLHSKKLQTKWSKPRWDGGEYLFRYRYGMSKINGLISNQDALK